MGDITENGDGVLGTHGEPPRSGLGTKVLKIILIITKNVKTLLWKFLFFFALVQIPLIMNIHE